MNTYKCTKCGKPCYSSADPETATNNKCPYKGCTGTVVLVRKGVISNEKV